MECLQKCTYKLASFLALSMVLFPLLCNFGYASSLLSQPAELIFFDVEPGKNKSQELTLSSEDPLHISEIYISGDVSNWLSLGLSEYSELLISKDNSLTFPVFISPSLATNEGDYEGELILHVVNLLDDSNEVVLYTIDLIVYIRKIPQEIVSITDVTVPQISPWDPFYVYFSLENNGLHTREMGASMILNNRTHIIDNYILGVISIPPSSQIPIDQRLDLNLSPGEYEVTITLADTLQKISHSTSFIVDDEFKNSSNFIEHVETKENISKSFTVPLIITIIIIIIGLWIQIYESQQKRDH